MRHSRALALTEFSPVPFWFWNDDLSLREIKRQLDDFRAHHVYGVIIHPRIGLPKTLRFMNEAWLGFVEQAVAHAEKTGMHVYLYDEGMYPSGSAQGQVVGRNPEYASRCIRRETSMKGIAPVLETGERIVVSQKLDSRRDVHIIDGKSHGAIRGLHFDEEDGCPNAPLAADLLNPEAVQTFIEIVHEGYRKRLGRFFGSTIRGIFTDEPSLLGRCNRQDIFPWTRDLDRKIRALSGKDITSRLPELWDSKSAFKREYLQLVGAVFDKTYYQPISRWCERNHVALIGHPNSSSDIGRLRFFQIPCQDVIFHYIEPYHKNALRSPHAVMAKCSASAALHGNRFRNGNECFGNYGHGLTFNDTRWLTHWLLARGVNLIIPHAFYYSIRGKRRDERPPDVGPNSRWWKGYSQYADFVSRVCAILAHSKPVSKVAIIGNSDYLPFESAALLQENQIDFQYIEIEQLRKKNISSKGVFFGRQRYSCLVLEKEVRVDADGRQCVHALKQSKRLVHFKKSDGASFVRRVRQLTDTLPFVHPAQPNLRVLPLKLNGRPMWLLCNEGRKGLTFQLGGISIRGLELYDPWTDTRMACPETIQMPPLALRILG